MHIAFLANILANAPLLSNVYLGANICEFVITGLLFYIGSRTKRLDLESEERSFHLNNFLLVNALIEEFAAAGNAPSSALLDRATRSFSVVVRPQAEIHPTVSTYEEYRTLVEPSLIRLSGEQGIRELLHDKNRSRTRLEYTELGLFILLIIFEIFATWYIFQP